MMRTYYRWTAFLLVFSLALIITGCSDSTGLDHYGYIRGHITLANTLVEPLVNQSSIEKVKTNIKSLKKSNQTKDYVEDEIIVSFKESADIKRILKKYKLSIKKSVKELGVKTLTGIGKRDIKTLIKELSNEEEVNYAELNKIVRVMAVEVNDSYYSTKQLNYLAISLPEAWELSTGSVEVTVAVIDTGIDLDHPDLTGQLVEGTDVVGDDEDYFPGADDRNGHGTHVAGIIGATTNNGVGIAGVNWNISLMPIRVLDSSGIGNNQTISAGIVWAVNHGADIINLSVGSFSNDPMLQRAVDYAYDAGVTIIAASGNDGKNSLRYPAAYKNTISVGSINYNYNRSYFSNYGTVLDFVAPGEYIYSTVPSGLTGYSYQMTDPRGYEYSDGTSMATPHVTGVAALILARARAAGNNLTPEQLKEELRLTAQDLGDKGRDDQFGYGLINAHAAVADARITKAKIFAGEETDYGIKLKSDIINVRANGTYELKNPDEGNYYIYCWIDLDQEGETGYNRVDKGDYFARTSSPVSLGNNTDLKLTLITKENFQELEIIN
jgi:serine protease